MVSLSRPRRPPSSDLLLLALLALLPSLCQCRPPSSGGGGGGGLAFDPTSGAYSGLSVVLGTDLDRKECPQIIDSVKV